VRRKSIAYPYLALGLILFCWVSLPKSFSDRARSFTVASFTPVWKWGTKLFLDSSKRANETELSRLSLENQNLRTQIETVCEWLLSDGKIGEQWELYRKISQEQNHSPDGHWRSFFERRASHLRKNLQKQMMSIPAQVIYRDPTSWSSSLWVNAGEEENEALGTEVIAKNSPVVLGASLVGVVDFVGRKQSRIRLITDSGLAPSVRAVRGAVQNRELAALLQTVSSRLETREDLFSSSEEKELFLTRVAQLKSKVNFGWEDGYLAKGELHGSSAPFWRSRGQTLKGIGFNYDYPDEEGSARELRTGRPVGAYSGAVPILKEGDLLVTSGLDGVFPPGLLVGTVDWVGPLKEGNYAYEIEAKPCTPHLNDLQTVFILPSLSSE